MKEINPFKEENTINDLLLYYIDEDIRHIIATDIIKYNIYSIMEINVKELNKISIFNLYRTIFGQLTDSSKMDFYTDLYGKEKSLEADYYLVRAC